MRTLQALALIVFLGMSSLLTAQKIFYPETITWTSIVNCVVEDSQYSYLGTNGGIVRIERSTGEKFLYHIANSTLPSNIVLSMTIGADHTLWVGTNHGIASLSGDIWQNYHYTMPLNIVNYIHCDAFGNVYAGGKIGLYYGLARYDGNDWRFFSSEGTVLPNCNILDMASSPDGKLWFLQYQYNYYPLPGMSNGHISTLCSLDGDTITVRNLLTAYPELPEIGHVRCLEIDSEGAVWLCSTSTRALRKFYNDQWTIYPLAEFIAESFYPEAFIIDAEDNFWLSSLYKLAWISASMSEASLYEPAVELKMNAIVSAYQGKAIISRGFTYMYPEAGYIVFEEGEFSELSSAVNPLQDFHYISSHAVDNDGNHWLCGHNSQGLIKWDGVNWTQYTTENSILTTDYVSYVYADPTGGVWTAANGHLIRIRGELWEDYDCQGLFYCSPEQILRGPDNRLYIVNCDGICVWDITAETGYLYLGVAPNQLPSMIIYDIAVDMQNRLWIACRGKLVRAQGNNVSWFDTTNTPFSSSDFRGLCRDGSKLWIANLAGELAYYENNQFHLIDFSSFAQTPQKVLDIAVDNEHSVWLTGQGIPMFRYADGDLSFTDTPGHALTRCSHSSVLCSPDGTKWVSVYANGIIAFRGEIVGTQDPTQEQIPAPEVSNYPNPFPGSTTISFACKGLSPLSLNIYNLRGQLIRSATVLPNGTDDLQWYWDGQDDRGRQVSSGIYLIRIKGKGVQIQHRMMLVK